MVKTLQKDESTQKRLKFLNPLDNDELLEEIQ